MQMDRGSRLGKCSPCSLKRSSANEGLVDLFIVVLSVYLGISSRLVLRMLLGSSSRILMCV